MVAMPLIEAFSSHLRLKQKLVIVLPISAHQAIVKGPRTGWAVLFWAAGHLLLDLLLDQSQVAAPEGSGH